MTDAAWTFTNVTAAVTGTAAPLALGNPLGMGQNGDTIQQALLYRAADGNIHILQQAMAAPAGWTDTNIMADSKLGAVGMPACNSFPRDGALHIYSRSGAGHIEERFLSGTAYTFTDVTAKLSPLAAVGDPACCFWPVDGGNHVYARTSDGNLLEFLYKQNAWSFANLTRVIGASRASGDPVCFSSDVDSSLHVFYRSDNGQINYLYKTIGSNWMYPDIFTSSGAVLSFGNLLAFEWERGQSRHLFYRGIDNHLHELQASGNDPAAAWTDTDVSALLPNTPLPAGGLGGGISDLDGTKNVVYRGTDGHIYRISMSRLATPSTWQAVDMTATAQPTPLAPAGDPCWYVRWVQATMHIGYLAVGGQVVTLTSPVATPVVAPVVG